MESYDDDEALQPLPSVLENFDCGYPSENERKKPQLESGRLSTLQDKEIHDALYHQCISGGFSNTERNNFVDDGVYNHESKHEDGIEKLTLNNLDAPRDAYQPSYDGASSVVSSKKRDFGTHSVASQEYSNYESGCYEIPPTSSSRKAYSSVSHNAKRRSITNEIEKVPDHETSDPYSFYNVPNMKQRRQAREKNKYSNSEEKMSSAYLRFKTLNQIQPSKRNNHDTKPEFNTSLDATLPSSSSSCFNHIQKHGLNQALHAKESNFMSATNNNAPKAASCYSLPAEYGSHKWRSIYMQHDLHFEPVESLDNIEPLPIHSSVSNIDPIESLDNIEPLPIYSLGPNIDTHESLDNIEPLPIHSSGLNMEPRHYPNTDNADSEQFSAYNDRSDSISPSSDYQQLDNFDCNNLLQQNQPYDNPDGASLSEFGQDFDRLMTVEDPNELYNDANNYESDFSDSIQSTDNYKDNVDDTRSPIVSLSELEELELGTSFSQLVLSNYCKTLIKAKEVKGMRKVLKEGFAGLSCIHCANNYKKATGGRFFPSHIKTMSDTKKGLAAYSGHLYKCPGVSKELIQKLKKLQKTHEDERKKMKYGSQKAFFSLIWVRLHGEMKEK